MNKFLAAAKSVGKDLAKECTAFGMSVGALSSIAIAAALDPDSIEVIVDGDALHVGSANQAMDLATEAKASGATDVVVDFGKHRIRF